MATKKYNDYHDLFVPMYDFAVDNGMELYFGDLMHDAANICEMTANGKPWTMMFAARDTGCGTDFLTPDMFKQMENDKVFDSNRQKATVSYDGEFFYFITED